MSDADQPTYSAVIEAARMAARGDEKALQSLGSKAAQRALRNRPRLKHFVVPEEPK
jgi:hypothetical protein